MRSVELRAKRRRERVSPTHDIRVTSSLNWPEIAAALVQPWPEAAVLEDLNWWLNEAKQSGERVPGRPFFCARWGWKPYAVRQMLDDIVRVTEVMP